MGTVVIIQVAGCEAGDAVDRAFEWFGQVEGPAAGSILTAS